MICSEDSPSRLNGERLTMNPWLSAAECRLLQLDAEADAASLRLVQRLVEIALFKQDSASVAPGLLEEIGTVLRADMASVFEASPEWRPVWSFTRRGLVKPVLNLPTTTLGEVLDRTAGTCLVPAAGQPAFVAACLSFRDKPNRALLVNRPRESFSQADLEYAVAAAHYLGIALEKAAVWDETHGRLERLAALLAIAGHLVEQRDIPALLEHIADQATRLLKCQRASIFLWDQPRRQLVGRPALGLPNNELRVPDDAGIVGKVLSSGEVTRVDHVKDDPTWSSSADQATGFKTRNLLAVSLRDAKGEKLGVFEALNKTKGAFTAADVETLQALAVQTAAALQNVREREQLLRTNAQLEGQVRQGSRLIGESSAIQTLRQTLERVSRTDLPVLILGESGTGKEVVARSIHFGSPRHRQPFIPVNCAAIAETLLESELFGHEKGAFTDAHSMRQGKFELASGGTIFLDEIGDMSVGGQAKLLRVLEEKVINRVGGSAPISVDTRIVAATNRNLAEAVQAGKFREDLFYRLSVVTLDLPPLRDRREDILLLAEHFLEHFCRDAGRKTLKCSAEARKRLEQHPWPGNVRELRNLMERVAFLGAGDKVEPGDLYFIVRPPSEEKDRLCDLPLTEATDAFQREHINRAIERARRNMSDAAKLLGMHRSNLYRKMRLLGMEPEERP
jgi:Nif-specific regulatory protein